MPGSRQRALLEDRFVFQNPRLFFASARLFVDRIELSGWHIKGRFFECVPLTGVLHVDAPLKESLVIWLAFGGSVRIRIPRAIRWKADIEALLRNMDAPLKTTTWPSKATTIETERHSNKTGRSIQ